jgi:hypothetical protein
MLGGGLLLGAIHLSAAVFYPTHLVQLTDNNGRRADGVNVEIGELHFFEIFIGGICAIITACLMLHRAYSAPKK